MALIWDPNKYGLQKYTARLAQQQLSRGLDQSYTDPDQDFEHLEKLRLPYHTDIAREQPDCNECNMELTSRLETREQTPAETADTHKCSRQRSAENSLLHTSTSKSLIRNSNTSTHCAMDEPIEDGDEAQDAQEQLLAATQGALRKISSKAKRISKHDTSALKDLALARSPVDTSKPQKSRRHWALQMHDVPQLDPEKEGKTAEQPDLDPVSAWSLENSQNLRKSKWASKDETRFEKTSVGSNDWGSNLSSIAADPSDTSDAMLGKLLHQPAGDKQNAPIYDWDGNWLPPDADWQNRPRFHNNNPAFKESFKSWRPSISSTEKKFSNGNTLIIVTKEQLMNRDLVPDGITYISKTLTVGNNLARNYGYVNDVTEFASAVPLSASDDPTSSKVDMNDPLNREYATDTTEMYVQNWLAHAHNYGNAEQAPGQGQQEPLPALVSQPDESSEDTDNAQVPDVGEESKVVPNAWAPKLNVFLRPARDEDVPELTRIYNWHIQNSVRPSETASVSHSAMMYRLQSSNDGHLPFFVAVMKSQKRASGTDPDIEFLYSQSSEKQRLVQNQRTQERLTTYREKLVGFCCVQDFSCADYVEHISAEIEIYVDGGLLHQGVGRCLIDKMLEICDFGYRPHGGYLFVCTEQERHLYSTRGSRDVHKLWFVVRNYHKPKASKLKPSSQKALKNTAFVKTNENEFDSWLRPWLESYGFEIEGHLYRTGAKQGR